MKKTILKFLSVFIAGLSILSSLQVQADEGKPVVIRIGFPGTGTGNRPIVGGSPLSTAHLKGWVEEEFKKDGIKIEWNHFKFAGPGINEAFANKLLDFSYEGDLAMIIGKAGGLNTKVLAGGGVRIPVAIAVPNDSPIKTLADLKGKRFAVQKGTAIQLAEVRALAKAGLEDKDVRAVNILGANATDALQTKDMDAVISIPYSFYPLRDRGVAKIIYDSQKSGDTDIAIAGGFIGDDAFIKKYPDITKRLLKVFVKAAQYSSDEANRNELFKLWGQDGTGFQYYREVYNGATLAERQTPLLDEYWFGRFKDGIADAKKYKLIRKDFDVNGWVDKSYLEAALKELSLENNWTAYSYDGKPIKH